MKKFAKVNAVLAIILIVLGGSICMAAGFCGGYRSVAEMAARGELSWEFDDFKVDLWGNQGFVYFSIGEDWEWEDSRLIQDEIYEIPVDTENTSIQSMIVEAGGGRVRFLEGKEGTIRICSNGTGYRIYDKNGTLHIQGKRNHQMRWFGFRNDSLTSIDLDIYLPQGIHFENVEIAFGGGEVELEYLEANNLAIASGAASVKAASLTVHNKLEIAMGAGKVEMKNAMLNHVEIAAGAGSVKIAGRITGDCSVDAAMGSTEMLLYGAETDHNYKIDCVAGEITVGGRSYAGMAAEQYIRNEADSTFELTCAMGEVSIKFIEE